LNQEAIHDWVRADSFTDMMQANIVRGRLEAEGIPSIIANEHTVTADWTHSLALGGVRVMVPPYHLQDAREVIKQIDAGEFMEDEEPEQITEEDQCPTCKNKLTRNEPMSWKVSILLGSLLMLPMPFRKYRYDCAYCKK
jgi:hypothetical protein